MKVIEASYEILSDDINITDRIEAAGRVAYKSEDKINEESGDKFINHMIDKGHWPTMDMGCVHLLMHMGASSYASFLNIVGIKSMKYLQFDVIAKATDRPGDKLCLMSGSPRALTEFLNKFKVYNLMAFIGCSLHAFNPVCFSGLKIGYKGMHDMFGIEVSDNLEVLKDSIGRHEVKLSDEVYKKHKHVGVKFIHNRAFTHEIVRHRPCGFLQESQRYCRYSLGKFNKEVTFISPSIFDFDDMDLSVWEAAMQSCEEHYFHLLENNSPQAARTVLPNSCKTEITVFCNLMQWEHMFRLRTSKAAEPSMRQVMIPLCEKIVSMYQMIDIETPPYE